LVDFLPVKSVDGRDAAIPVAGGSCLNIAVGVARLGAPSGFVGGISTDLFGRIIADHALASQVQLRYATRSDHQTTLAFVRDVGGEPQYAFYDEATASRNWTYQRGCIPFDQVEAIHVGSTTLANEQGAGEALTMVEDAGGSVTISFDPNCRPNLVRHKARYIEQMHAFASAADIVRMSDVDFEFLYGRSDHAEAAKSLIKTRAGLVVITRGIKGAQAWHGEVGAVEVQAPTVDVVEGSRRKRSRRSNPTNSLARCHLRQAAQPSHAGGSVPIHRDKLTLAPNCLVSSRIRSNKNAHAMG